jgi:hypothetical protein
VEWPAHQGWRLGRCFLAVHSVEILIDCNHFAMQRTGNTTTAPLFLLLYAFGQTLGKQKALLVSTSVVSQARRSQPFGLARESAFRPDLARRIQLIRTLIPF